MDDLKFSPDGRRFISEADDIIWRKKWLMLQLANLQRDKEIIDRELAALGDSEVVYHDDFSCCSRFRTPPIINLKLENLSAFSCAVKNPVHPINGNCAPINFLQSTDSSSEAEHPEEDTADDFSTEMEIPEQSTEHVMIDTPMWCEVEDSRAHGDCRSSEEDPRIWAEHHRNMELVEARLRRGFASNGFNESTIPEAFKAGMRVDGEGAYSLESYFTEPKVSIVMPEWEPRLYDHPESLADEEYVRKVRRLQEQCNQVLAKCEGMGQIDEQALSDDLKEVEMLKNLEVRLDEIDASLTNFV